MKKPRIDRKSTFRELKSRLGMNAQNVALMIGKSVSTTEGYSSDISPLNPPQEVIDILCGALRHKATMDIQFAASTSIAIRAFADEIGNSDAVAEEKVEAPSPAPAAMPSSDQIEMSDFWTNDGGLTIAVSPEAFAGDAWQMTKDDFERSRDPEAPLPPEDDEEDQMEAILDQLCWKDEPAAAAEPVFVPPSFLTRGRIQ